LICRRLPGTAPDRLRCELIKAEYPDLEKRLLNARVEIGDDGVEVGQVEHKVCEETISCR
jgi:hypothetical protein